MTLGVLISGVLALCASIFRAVWQAAGDAALAADRQRREKEDAELQATYDEIARAGVDSARLGRVLDDGKF